MLMLMPTNWDLDLQTERPREVKERNPRRTGGGDPIRTFTLITIRNVSNNNLEVLLYLYFSIQERCNGSTLNVKCVGLTECLSVWLSQRNIESESDHLQSLTVCLAKNGLNLKPPSIWLRFIVQNNCHERHQNNIQLLNNLFLMITLLVPQCAMR